jgi:CBS domain-containing protein
MQQLKASGQPTTHHAEMIMERRDISRAPVSFGVMYSGIINNEALIGDGTVIDLSNGGLGIRGNQPVLVGTELTLFLYLPDGADPLFVLETTVTWAKGSLFGLQFQKLSLREGNRLQAFIQAQYF